MTESKPTKAESKPTKGTRDSEIRSALTILLAALVVALLAAANIQLANVDTGGSPSATAPTAIAPPVQGTSNNVLSEKLHQLSENFNRPLRLLRAQLTPLNDLSSGQEEASDSFDSVAHSIDRLASVRHELNQLDSGLGEVVGSTSAMAGNLGASTRTLKGVDESIGATGKTTQGMARTMRRVEASIVSSGQSTSEATNRMSEGISAMQDSLAGQRKELNASMAELNGNMTKFLKLMCILLTSESECDPDAA